MSKTFIQKLLSDDEGKRLYLEEDFRFEITEFVSKTMLEKHITNASLAQTTGVQEDHIVQFLSGDVCVGLSTIVHILYALGFKLQISFTPLRRNKNG